MTKAEVKIFMKKVKEAGDKVLDEETAYIIYKNVPLDLAISSRLEEIETFKEENIQKWLDEGNYEPL